MDISRMKCKLGLHKWSEWTSVNTALEATTGHDVLDAVDNVSIETKTRYCEACMKGDIKQRLVW